MDEYDVVDFIYEAVAAAVTDVLIIKDKTDAGVSVEHIVINNVTHVESDFTSKTPVNVNIFVPLVTGGMVKRQRMKELRRAVRKSIGAINSDDGNCREVYDIRVNKMPDLKEGFDCVNIRFEVLTDK